MQTSISPIALPHNQWVELYATSGITAPAVLRVQMKAGIQVDFALSPSEPTTEEGGYLKAGESVELSHATGVWVKATANGHSRGSSVTVQDLT